jgi:hypothetical protein
MSYSVINLTKEMHSHGINMRYLGIVYNFLLGRVLNHEKSATVSSRLVLMEACARVMKNLLYISLQSKMKEQKLVMEVPYRRVVVEKLNLWFAEEPPLSGEDFWDSPNGKMQKMLTKDFNFISFSKFYPPIYPDKAVFRALWSKMISPRLRGLPAELPDGSRANLKPRFRKSGVVTSEWISLANIGQVEKIEETTKVPHRASSTFRTDISRDSHLVLSSKEGSQSVHSLKKYLFFDREVGIDGRILGWWIMFDRLTALTGLIFTDDILCMIRDETGTYRLDPTEPFSLHDLVSMEGRVKHMNTVCAAVGTFFQLKGLIQSQKEFAATNYCRAIEKFEEALADVPNDKAVLFSISITYFRLLSELHGGKEKVRFDLNDSVVRDAKEYFHHAIENEPKNYVLYCYFAMFLTHCGLYAEAEACFLDCLEIEPNFPYGLFEYAQFLLSRDQIASATAVMKRLKEINIKVNRVTNMFVFIMIILYNF